MAAISDILRLVLLSGGEFPVIGMLRGGLRFGAIRTKIGTLFPALDPGDVGRLLEIAREATSAGAWLTQQPGGSPFSIDPLPIQPFLFGTSPGASRVLIGVDVNVPGLDRDIFVSVRLPDSALPDDVRRAAIEIAVDRMFKSPDAFDDIIPDKDTMMALEFAFAERLY